MKNFFCLTIVLCAFCLVRTMAQGKVYYSCDFEKAEDRARWVLNPTADSVTTEKLVNQWYIGEAGNHDFNGHYGLYVSDDNGISAHYTNSPSMIFAYDTLSLPRSYDDYILTFDCRARGDWRGWPDPDMDMGLYAFWIPMVDSDGDSVNICSMTSNESLWILGNYIIPLSYNQYLRGVFGWEQCVTTIPHRLCDGTPHYLAYAWINGDVPSKKPGGVIDNIKILETRPCDGPTNLEVSFQGRTSYLSWNGTASEYEVTAYSYEQSTWFGPIVVQGSSVSFDNLPMGITEFAVRAKCTNGLYGIQSSITEVVYYPDLYYVDYLNIYKAKCYVNQSKPSTSTLTFSDYIQVKPVDKGYASIESRHTVHYDQTEYDPHTGNLLKTIPEGEVASVRLGNWMNGAETERIEYSFLVDTLKAPVMILKYATILESPNHKDYENPRFTLDVFVEQDSVTCAKADFNSNDVYQDKQLKPGSEEQGWHLTPRDVAQLRADVVWKDWTTVGVNLKKQEFAGKTIVVRLTTYDCVLTAHSGYAYFTLGRSDGRLKNRKSGVINLNMTAPDGFLYNWYYAKDEIYRRRNGVMPQEYVLTNAQTLAVDMSDDNLYAVDCMFVQDSTNYFTLYASSFAAVPKPIGEYKKDPVDKNAKTYTVHFNASKSYVEEYNHVAHHAQVARKERLDSLVWNFGDGTYSRKAVENHIYPAPEMRDTTYIATLTAYYLDGVSIDTIPLFMAALNPTAVEKIENDDVSQPLLPTWTQALQPIKTVLSSPSIVRIYTIAGICCYSRECQAGEQFIAAPATPGLYTVEVTSSSGKRTAQRVLVQ